VIGVNEAEAVSCATVVWLELLIAAVAVGGGVAAVPPPPPPHALTKAATATVIDKFASFIGISRVVDRDRCSPHEC
jgi:hypothetical protein